MKTLLLFLSFLLLTATAFAQNTLIVDNTGSAPTGDHIYTNLQEAIDAAQAGDVIQVMPSETFYGNITLDGISDLKIYGAGFNPDLISNVETNESILSQLAIGNSDNIEIKGIVVSNQNPLTINNSTSVVIESNRLNAGFTVGSSSITNLMIKKNLIYSSFTISASATTSAVFVANNIIVATQGRNFSFNKITLNNNLIIGHDVSSVISGIESIYNNNIIHGFTSNDITHSVFNYNLVETDLAVNDGSSGEFNVIKSFTIAEILADDDITKNTWGREWDNTPVDTDIINGGSDGTDIGPSGGSDPYESKTFILPGIFDLIFPLTIKEGTNTEVTIKAKGN